MILLVDNKTIFMKYIRSFLKEHRIKYKIKDHRNVRLKDSVGMDAIILSGGTGRSKNPYFPEFKKELELIKKARKPIFGICLGFELICHAYESKITEMKILSRLERGIFPIKIIKKDHIFKNCPKTVKVFGCHRWSFVKVSKKLEILAASKDCIEAVRHKTKPIYAVQFHPEVTRGNRGYKTLENFLKLIK